MRDNRFQQPVGWPDVSDGRLPPFDSDPANGRNRRYVAVRERIDEGRQIHKKPTFKLRHQALVVRPGGGACGKPSA